MLVSFSVTKKDSTHTNTHTHRETYFMDVNNYSDDLHMHTFSDISRKI